jgi:hypothetical protein
MMRRFISSAGTTPGDDELTRDPRGGGHDARGGEGRNHHGLNMTQSLKHYVARRDSGPYPLR